MAESTSLLRTHTREGIEGSNPSLSIDLGQSCSRSFFLLGTFMSKNVFITGAAGFIGFHLASYLRSRGDNVIGFDNFNGYYSTRLKRARADLLKESGVTIIEGDLCDKDLLQRSVFDHRTDNLVHLAAQAGVRYSLEAPESYIRSNIDGFMNVLEVCRHRSSIKLTYASSSSVYGNNTKVPFSVEDMTESQTSLYGVTKKSNELMAKTYHHLFGIQVTGLRFFTVYGPWGRPDMAYYGFTRSIREGKPIDLYEGGTLLRDFTYVDDIIHGTTAAMDLGAPCEIFNLGNHRPVSVTSMVELLESLCKKKAVIRYLPMPNADVPVTYADISYSREKLGFEPKTSLEKGLEIFMKWFLEYEAKSAH